MKVTITALTRSRIDIIGGQLACVNEHARDRLLGAFRQRLNFHIGHWQWMVDCLVLTQSRTAI